MSSWLYLWCCFMYLHTSWKIIVYKFIIILYMPLFHLVILFAQITIPNHKWPTNWIARSGFKITWHGQGGWIKHDKLKVSVNLMSIQAIQFFRQWVKSNREELMDRADCIRLFTVMNLPYPTCNARVLIEHN